MPDISAIKEQIAQVESEISTLQAQYEQNKEDTQLAASIIEKQTNRSQLYQQLATELEKADPLSVDIESRLSQVRKEEKQKLHSAMDKLKAENEERAKKAQELENQLKELSDQIEQNRQNAKKDGEGDGAGNFNPDTVSKIVEDALQKERMRQEQELAALKAEANQEVLQLRQQLEKAELDKYRSQAISKYGDKIIPELVSGSTKEEIDDSALKAHQTYERIYKEAGEARAGAESSIRDQQLTPPNTEGGFLSKLTQEGGELTADQIRKMSPEQWKEHRKKLGFN